MAKKKTKIKYIFDRKTCPRCNSGQTRAYSTQGRLQYRKCMAPICQYRFVVRGRPEKVEVTE